MSSSSSGPIGAGAGAGAGAMAPAPQAETIREALAAFEIPPGAGLDARPPWTLLLALAACLALGEWLLHHRRVTT